MTKRVSRDPSGSRPVYAVKAEFFKALSNPVRIRILELLRDGERSVGDLGADMLLEQSNVSQQLAVLRERGFLISRREGSTVFYRVKDPRIFGLLSSAKEIITSALTETRELLDDLDRLEFTARKPARPR
ncbi:MAG: ArsR/SmtB family transcription factor [Actinomycetota bacterium]